MGMDGLSIANTGALKESTSADFASRAEQIVQADPTNDTRQVQMTKGVEDVTEKDFRTIITKKLLKTDLQKKIPILKAERKLKNTVPKI